jgi:hypothetical protein
MIVVSRIHYYIPILAFSRSRFALSPFFFRFRFASFPFSFLQVSFVPSRYCRATKSDTQLRIDVKVTTHALLLCLHGLPYEYAWYITR